MAKGGVPKRAKRAVWENGQKQELSFDGKTVRLGRDKWDTVKHRKSRSKRG